MTSPKILAKANTFDPKDRDEAFELQLAGMAERFEEQMEAYGIGRACEGVMEVIASVSVLVHSPCTDSSIDASVGGEVEQHLISGQSIVHCVKTVEIDRFDQSYLLRLSLSSPFCDLASAHHSFESFRAARSSGRGKRTAKLGRCALARRNKKGRHELDCRRFEGGQEGWTRLSASHHLRGEVGVQILAKCLAKYDRDRFVNVY